MLDEKTKIIATDLLNCPICLEIFLEPIIGSNCGHTVCNPCLKKLDKNICPTCRERDQKWIENFVVADVCDCKKYTKPLAFSVRNEEDEEKEEKEEKDDAVRTIRPSFRRSSRKSKRKSRIRSRSRDSIEMSRAICASIRQNRMRSKKRSSRIRDSIEMGRAICASIKQNRIRSKKRSIRSKKRSSKKRSSIERRYRI